MADTLCLSLFSEYLKSYHETREKSRKRSIFKH